MILRMARRALNCSMAKLIKHHFWAKPHIVQWRTEDGGVGGGLSLDQLGGEKICSLSI